jgi:electron-transferring-flavoprotein dehydrogenase
MGISKEGEPTGDFQLGMELHGQVHHLRRRCARPPGQAAHRPYKLDANRDPQTYGIGIKELWEIDPASQARPGGAHRRLAHGERHLRRCASSTTWKTIRSRSASSPAWTTATLSVSIRGDAALEDPSQYPLLPGRRRSQWHRSGKRISYGARAITAGGLCSLPKLVFPGGALVGCDAGFLNASRIKGSHAAIKTGMLAAEAAFAAWSPVASTTSCRLPDAFEQLAARRAAQGTQLQAWFKKGLTTATLMTAWSSGSARQHPWTLHATSPTTSI